MPTSIFKSKKYPPEINLTEQIRFRAAELGFQETGIADPASIFQAGIQFLEALDLGWHGEMDWLKSKAHLRANPRSLWNETKAVIMFGASYAPDSDPLKLLSKTDIGVVSVYARRRDYHDILKKRLKKIARWLNAEHQAKVKVFVDTAPVLEKPLAQKAGIGWQGKHTNLVSKTQGSWLFLGTIFTDLPLTPTNVPHPNHCGNCQRCLEVCPTDAFPAPYQLDARRCIAYLTIEHKGHIDKEFRAAIGNRVFGCDDCLAVCPWNRFAQQTKDMDLAEKPEFRELKLSYLLSLDEKNFNSFSAGTPLRRLGYSRLIRNSLIAAGNSKDKNLSVLAAKHLNSAFPIIRAMAVWALSQLLTEKMFRKLRDKHISKEANAYVYKEWQKPKFSRLNHKIK